MRKVTQQTVNAFRLRQNLKIANSEANGPNYTLHGNPIARIDKKGVLEISLAGWDTATTRNRLDAIVQTFDCNARVYRNKGMTFFRCGKDSALLCGSEWIDTGLKA